MLVRIVKIYYNILRNLQIYNERLIFLTRKELNRQRTIEDIESASLSLYEKRGIDGVSISALCKKSEVARSTFYIYFEDKYAVLQKAEDRLLSQL